MRLEGGDDRVVTPEAVVLDLEPATVGSRGVALVLDVAIIGALATATDLATDVLGGGGFVPGWLGIALLLLGGFLAQFGYPVGFETLWRGRTPGKAVMGLRVVTVEGAPVGVRHATVRAAVGILELTATVGLLAAITSLLSSRGQRLGDLAAGTLVIRERRATGGRVEAHAFVPPPGLESYAATLDVSAVGAAEYATVRDVLRRLPSLPPRSGTRVAEQVAANLAPRVTPPPPEGLDAARWLTCVAAAVQRRGVAGPPPATPSRRAPAWDPPTAPTPPDGTPEGATPVDARHAEARHRRGEGTGGFAPPG